MLFFGIELFACEPQPIAHWTDSVPRGGWEGKSGKLRMNQSEGLENADFWKRTTKSQASVILRSERLIRAAGLMGGQALGNANNFNAFPAALKVTELVASSPSSPHAPRVSRHWIVSV